MIKKKHLLLFCLLLIVGISSAQNNEELAKSYFLQAQEAYGNENTEAAISSLDNCVKMLGKTNAKIEALYIEIKRANLGPYYDLEVKKHLDNYLKLASTDRPEYEDILKSVPYIKRSAESYKKNLAKALKDNANRNWELNGPIYIDFMGHFNSNGELAFYSNFGVGGSYFRDGYAMIQKHDSDYYNYKTYLINKNGRKISNTMYDEIYRKNNGVYITVQTINNDEYYGLINTDLNKELKTPSFVCTDIKEFQNNGLAVFKNKKDQYGLINTAGEIIVDAIYKEIGVFNNGLAKATLEIKRNGDYDYVDRFIKVDGTIAFEAKPDWSIGNYNKDSLVSFKITSLGNKYGYFENSEIIIPTQYNYASDFSEGLAIVKNDDGYSIIDTKNKVLGYVNKEFRFPYNTSKLFVNGMAVLENKSGNSHFVIDKYGKSIYENKESRRMKIISENNVLFIDNQYPIKYYIINLDTNVLKDLNLSNNIKIDKVYEYSEGLALFHTGDAFLKKELYGYIDLDGNVVVSPIYYGGKLFKDGKAIVYDKYFNEIEINP